MLFVIGIAMTLAATYGLIVWEGKVNDGHR
jgi:hypothetical protein